MKHKCKSSIPDVYDTIDVEFDAVGKKVTLLSVIESGREIVNLLKPATQEKIKNDCLKSIEGGQKTHRTGQSKFKK